MNNIEVIINNIKWNIKFVSKPFELLSSKFGLCSYEENCIYIQSTLTSQNKKLVLIHELTHAYEYQFGLRHRVSESRYEDLAEFVSIYGEQILDTAKKILLQVEK